MTAPPQSMSDRPRRRPSEKAPSSRLIRSTKPDLLYVSTYFPEGVEIVKALTAAGPKPRCLMGLANVDNGFLAKTTLAAAQRCVFSGVPAATGSGS
jgi:hypothetical protein